MSYKEVPEEAINAVAEFINKRSNKNYSIPVVGDKENIETPQIFEITPFREIDNLDRRFFAIDGSYNSQEFYNGVSLGIYAAGYICFEKGKQLRMNNTDDPVVLGKAYYPSRILVTTEQDRFEIYDELLALEPVRALLGFFVDAPGEVFAYTKEAICANLNTLLSFSQEILEFALIHEIAHLPIVKSGDYILRDGTLRPLQIKQRYIVKLARLLKEKGVVLLAITKNSPVKMELSYTFKQIDIYLQDKLKPQYKFNNPNPTEQKLCCWLEVPDTVLHAAYGTMYAKKDIEGGRGAGVFFAARLDYVEKLQNYDWLIADLNIFDVMPGIDNRDLKTRDMATMQRVFEELTTLTQEHYILGYPYPLVEAHNFISLKKAFKEEIIKRVKFALYENQQMDNVDIENLFLDIHDRF